MPDEDLDDEREAATEVLEAGLLYMCDGCPADVAISALAGALQEVVIACSRDREGVEEFARIFHEELRSRWLLMQPTTSEEVS